LLKWKELAQRKTKLGKKINYVPNAITQHKIGEETSQESFEKLFKPVTSKLDDVIDSNLNLRMPQRKKRPPKKAEVPNYGIDIEDEFEDTGLDDLFGDYVPPQQEKQIVPKPGKEIYVYVDPQYFPEYLGELPPEYDEDEGVDYAIITEDETREILDDLGIPNYESIDMNLNQPQMTPQKTKGYFK